MSSRLNICHEYRIPGNKVLDFVIFYSTYYQTSYYPNLLSSRPSHLFLLTLPESNIKPV